MDKSYDAIISSTEIIKDRLYFATLKTGYKPKATKNSKYFHIEDEIIYEGFFLDFGPYHLCHLYQFCNKLNSELEKNPKKKIVFYSSDNERLRLNAAYLIGSYQIIYMNGSPQEVFQLLDEDGYLKRLCFRDASGTIGSSPIYLLDVLQGIKLAFDGGFFDFKHFDEHEYLFYEKVENGDLNWIIPQKMLAFSGPSHRSRLDNGYPLHCPEHYHQYFRENNVTTIVRLNKKTTYDARQFTAHGFEHRDLYFVDGSMPSNTIVNRFIKLSEAARGAVAVHCKAGLGRTGTLIGCYLIRHHGFSARAAIAWMRVCRPGSVIGCQQWFLEQIEARMKAEGEAYRRARNITTLPVFSRGVYSTLPPPMPAPATTHHPVTLASILNNRTNKLDNANDVNANEKDSENNITAVIGKYKTVPTPTLPIKTTAGLKPQPRILTSTLKSHYAAKTSTFPPTRSANAAAKVTVKSQFIGKSSFHGQRANLAKTTPSATIPTKTLKKAIPSRATSTPDVPPPTAVATVTSTLTALTENCHLNGKNRTPSEPNLKTLQNKPVINKNLRKKLPGSKTISTSFRKKLPKEGSTLDETRQELSSSDTNINNVANTFQVPFRLRMKRAMGANSEPMECISHSIITPDVTPDNYEETQDSQGNRLYKIKALRRKNSLKKNGVQTRSSSCVDSVRKK